MLTKKSSLNLNEEHGKYIFCVVFSCKIDKVIGLFLFVSQYRQSIEIPLRVSKHYESNHYFHIEKAVNVFQYAYFLVPNSMKSNLSLL